MRSRDGGRSWAIADLEPEKLDEPAAFERIPAMFANQPDGAASAAEKGAYRFENGAWRPRP